MGDVNDEPFDSSLVTHALSTRQAIKVPDARDKPLPWNLMGRVAGVPGGTFYFGNEPDVLDPVPGVHTNIIDDTPLHVPPDTARIRKPDLNATTRATRPP